MTPRRRLLLAAAILAALGSGGSASAEKQGGLLRVGHFDSPASMSPLEESTVAVNRPMTGVFNNLVMYDQHIAQNRPDTIVPDLAASWSWNEEGTELTMPLRHGVKWHDGQPFTARDVVCTWELLTGQGKDRLRINPRKGWYANLDKVTANGDYEVTFHLKRPQAAFLALLTSGWSPVYPCHVTAQQMRVHPLGTGPFKFVEFRPNEVIRVTRNPDYWKPGLPHLDGIEWDIIKNMSTRTLSFIAGQTQMLPGVTPPVLKQIVEGAPNAVCEGVPANVSRNVLINRAAAPFDNAELRRAVMLTLDRQAFNDILYEGKGTIGEAMMPPPAGLWGMPRDMLEKLSGYGRDVEQRRAEARKIMEKLGYGPNNRLSIKVSARNIPIFRDPAVILIDQLKSIYIDGDLDPVDTANWFPKVARHDYQIGQNNTGSGVDDPDQQFFENYGCGSERNYTGYCNRELEKMFEQQSMVADQQKRKRLVWEIDKRLQEDAARPIVYHFRAGTCWQPRLKGITVMINSQYNGWRMEDWWLDR